MDITGANVPRDTSPTVSDRRRSDLSDWLTKPQAADAIGVSTKAIERFAQARKLEQGSRPQLRGPNVAVYNPEDVARLASERHPVRAPWLLPADADRPARRNGARPPDGLVASAPTGLATTGDSDPLRAFAAAVYAAVMSQTSETRPAPRPETLYVTVKEAAEILGLPQADVRRLIHDGDLNHRLTGRGGVRIRRKDLEQL
jgi:excisionase family DNA binding protein